MTLNEIKHMFSGLRWSRMHHNPYGVGGVYAADVGDAALSVATSGPDILEARIDLPSRSSRTENGGPSNMTARELLIWLCDSSVGLPPDEDAHLQELRRRLSFGPRPDDAQQLSAAVRDLIQRQDAPSLAASGSGVVTRRKRFSWLSWPD